LPKTFQLRERRKEREGEGLLFSSYRFTVHPGRIEREEEGRKRKEGGIAPYSSNLRFR